jgi:hypothetical protein
MKDLDAQILWEAYVTHMEDSKPDFADIDKDGDKKETMKKAAKDKEEDTETVEETDHSNIRTARSDEENEAADRKKKGEKAQNDQMEEDLRDEEKELEEDVVEEEMYDCIRDYMSDGYTRSEAEEMCGGRGYEESVKEEGVLGRMGSGSLPEDDVFKAVELAEGGDWQDAIETAVSAIANHMIYDITQSSNGPLDDAETADVWNIKDGIKHAMDDLFGGASAETYEAFTKNLRNAFHKGQKEDEYEEPEEPINSLEMLGMDAEDFGDPDHELR